MDKTIAAIVTGMSPSGVGIIRISGDDAFEIASSVFRTKTNRTLQTFTDRHIYYGYLYDGNQLLDEVLLLPMKGPHSYTGEDIVELQCHGGVFIMNRILRLVLQNGAQMAEPGEFTKRAFVNGRMDLSEAEAVMDVIESQNEYAMMNSVRHLTGSLHDSISAVRKDLLYETAYIESALDDPEHISLDGYPEHLRTVISDIYSKLQHLYDSFSDGKIISEGIHTVILGKPNVGKSSFLNVLLGEERAIVTEYAGTTRDVIEETVSFGGVILRIVDTAGIRLTDDPVEKIGVGKALSYARNADLILMMIDSSTPLTDSDEEIFDFIRENNKKSVILLNKSDLDPVISKAEIACYINSPVLSISAKNDVGVDEFKEYIIHEFVSGLLKYNDEIFLSNERHRECVSHAIEALNNVLESISMSLPEDFYTIDLVNAYENLGRIIGEQVDEDVVNEIFSKFCMGK